MRRSVEWFRGQQAVEGSWCGELEGDSILQSEYLLLLAWLGQTHTRTAQRCAAQLLRQQMPTGGWSMYPGGKLEISASVKAYFALGDTYARMTEPLKAYDANPIWTSDPKHTPYRDSFKNLRWAMTDKAWFWYPEEAPKYATAEIDRETQLYLPQLNNNIIWCFGTSSMEYHCSTAMMIGAA